MTFGVAEWENFQCGHLLQVRGDATLTAPYQPLSAVTMQFRRATRLVLVPEIPLELQRLRAA